VATDNPSRTNAAEPQWDAAGPRRLTVEGGSCELRCRAHCHSAPRSRSGRAPGRKPRFPPVDFTIAFIGDQGFGPDARAVLELIREEGADAVIHSGDFDYHDDPRAWEDQINSVLGEDFPYFASIGNHDLVSFFGPGGYQERLEARLERLGIDWDGELGVRSSLHYQGIFIVLTAPGIFVPDDLCELFDLCHEYDHYIRDQLASSNSIWKISSWHKNMHLMQVGTKPDETGWGVYEQSRRGGAIVATAHEHSYSRTHLLESFDEQTIASTSGSLVLSGDDPATREDEARGFGFVSGLGGRSVRNQDRGGAWWASIYTSDSSGSPDGGAPLLLHPARRREGLR
jgi:hypothetical protein